MFNVDEQILRLEQLYRQLTGNEPKRLENPIAPLPPDADPVQHVEDSMQRIQSSLQAIGVGAWAMMLPAVTPRIAVYETDKDWRCAVELPGVKKADLIVQILQGVLRVSSTRGPPGASNGEPQRPTYSETFPCRFERAVPMPPFVRGESAQARLENGILVIRCEKDPSAIRRDLKIEVA